MTKGFAITYNSFDSDISKVLQVTEYDIDISNLKPTQVALQALATPLNPSDLLQIKGVYTVPKKQTLQGKELHIGGNEGLFKILKTGSDVKDFHADDWVLPLLANFGTWRTHVIVDLSENTGSSVAPLIKVRNSQARSSKITLAEAATISVNPPTAYQLLEDYVDFDPSGKDWVIQNAGASQVSKFVLQLGKVRKINTISVVRGGKPNQKEIEEELIKLGATKVITEEQSQSDEYKKKIIPEWIAATGGKLKLALNSVGGASANALIDHLSTDGYLVSYGQMVPEPISYLSSTQLFKNLTTKAYWLTKNTKDHPESKVETVDAIVKLYESGELVNVEFDKTEFNLSEGTSEDYLKAYLSAVKNSTSGKQVVVIN